MSVTPSVSTSAPLSTPGFFLTFEGPEGAGKTTQMTRLAQALTQRGWQVTCTREPGGDSVGEKVRELLLNGSPDPETELLLFAAARAQNVRHVVRPALEAGHVVLCDRFVDSTVAYQGYGRGLSLDVISRVNHFATGGLVPDQTFLLNVPPSVGLGRKGDGEQNRLEREGSDFHAKVAQGFAKLAQAYPARIVQFDATLPADEVADQLLGAALALLGTRTPAGEADTSAPPAAPTQIAVEAAPSAPTPLTP